MILSPRQVPATTPPERWQPRPPAGSNLPQTSRGLRKSSAQAGTSCNSCNPCNPCNPLVAPLPTAYSAVLHPSSFILHPSVSRFPIPLPVFPPSLFPPLPLSTFCFLLSALVPPPASCNPCNFCNPRTLSTLYNPPPAPPRPPSHTHYSPFTFHVSAPPFR